MTHNFDTLPDDDVLSQSRFHFLLVAFHAPAGWPLWWVVLVGGGVAVAVAAAWWLLARDMTLAVAVAGALLAFFAADAALLRQLPRRRLSFGPWQGQIAALALPRAGVARTSVLKSAAPAPFSPADVDAAASPSRGASGLTTTSMIARFSMAPPANDQPHPRSGESANPSIVPAITAPSSKMPMGGSHTPP